MRSQDEASCRQPTAGRVPLLPRLMPGVRGTHGSVSTQHRGVHMRDWPPRVCPTFLGAAWPPRDTFISPSVTTRRDNGTRCSPFGIGVFPRIGDCRGQETAAKKRHPCVAVGASEQLEARRGA